MTTAPAAGACTQGLAPPDGEVLCAKYVPSESFKQLIVKRMMQDPMVLPVPLRSRKLEREASRRRRGRAPG